MLIYMKDELLCEIVEVLHSFLGANRLCAHREFCGVLSWQNGTRCRDSVKYCGASHISFGWFLRVPSLHTLVFVKL